MKKLLFSLLLLFSLNPLFSYDIEDLNGRMFLELTSPEQLGLISGFVIGYSSALDALYGANHITLKTYNAMYSYIADTTVGTIHRQVLAWYKRTNDLNCTVKEAILRRTEPVQKPKPKTEKKEGTYDISPEIRT